MTTTNPDPTDPADPADPADPRTWPKPPRGRCWFLGCPNEVPQVRDSGQAKAVCEQWVDGLKHTRLNRSLAQRGRITVPAAGSGPASPAKGTGPAAAEGEHPAKPVTAARQTYGQTLAQVQTALAELPALVERLEAAAHTVADQEQTAAEIATIERASRAQVDAAEAERDAALTQARAKEREAADALSAKDAAEETAEAALEAEELAAEERDAALEAKAAAEEREQHQRERADQAEAERDAVRAELDRTSERARRLAEELEAARGLVEDLRSQLAGAKQALADSAEDRMRLDAELVEQRQQTRDQRQRAEVAEQATSRAEATAEQLRTELAEARASAAQHQDAAAQSRADVAALTAQLAAAHERLDVEKAHADERLTEQRQQTRDHLQRAEVAEQATSRAEATIEALRGELAELRQHVTAEPAERPAGRRSGK